jgi:hypothetical protein
MAGQESAFGNAAYMGEPAEKSQAGDGSLGLLAARRAMVDSISRKFVGAVKIRLWSGLVRCGIGVAGWKEIRRRNLRQGGG